MTGTGGVAPVQHCTTAADCGPPNACGQAICEQNQCQVKAVSCDDTDPCTEDTCEDTLGCRHRPLALDLDGDKHKSPRPGFAPGAPGSCGDDCDDTNAASFPGNPEMCDGIDNDCDGVVDNGFGYQTSSLAPVRVSALDSARSQRDEGGLVATPDAFVFTYTGLYDDPVTQQRHESRLKGIDAKGSALFETPVSDVNASTYAGPVAWSGRDLATAWSDARLDGNYEVYATQFSAAGALLRPAARVTNSENFSLHPSLKWNQSEFLIAFDDRGSGTGPMDHSQIFGQRVAPDGSLIGGNVLLVGDDPVVEYPAISIGQHRVGLVYTSDVNNRSQLGFRVFSPSLAAAGSKPLPFALDVQSFSVEFVGDRFVVLWDTNGDVRGDAIWAAAYDEDANLTAAPRPITSGAHMARSQAALSLGDRLLVVWADDARGPLGSYELYWQILDLNLNVLVPRQTLTMGSNGALNPALVVGPGRKIGVTFEGWASGSQQVYFTSLECAPAR